VKYLDEYRDGELAQKIAREVHRVTTRPWNIMEVCGGNKSRSFTALAARYA
jgi:hydrogenase expression/formation protein HypD